MPFVVKVDRRLFLLVHRRFRVRWLDPVMIIVTQSGTKGVVWLGLASAVFLAGGSEGRRVALASVAALLITEGIINWVLKPSFARKRPFTRFGTRRLLVRQPGPHSWPSAHAGSSTAAAVTLAHAYHPWALLLLLLALLIAYSRVYVGVHYPLDVLAGVGIGIAVAIAVIVATSLLPIPI